MFPTDKEIKVIEECKNENYEKCEACPLANKCLFYWTGDDSELKGEK